MSHRAVFLDRDGTLIEEVGYAVRPEQIRILGGVARGLSRLAAAGYKLVVVTNQSAIARGLMTEDELNRFHQALDEQLELMGARVDVYYTCPHLPDAVEAKRPELAVECECRKPKPGLLLQAAHDLEIDLARSWMVGDTWRDIQAGQAAGTRTIRVPADVKHDAPRPADTPPPTAEAEDLDEAADVILNFEEPEPAAPPPVEPTPVEPSPGGGDEVEPAPPPPPAKPPAPAPVAAQPPADSAVAPTRAASVSSRVSTHGEKAATAENTRDTSASLRAGLTVAARKGDEPTAECARCGQPVEAADVLSGKAERRGGLLLCPNCLLHQPPDEDGMPETSPELLRALLSEVRHLGRRRHVGGLSLLRMLAYLVQAGALFAGALLFVPGTDRALYVQVAIFLQLLALTLLLFERNV